VQVPCALGLVEQSDVLDRRLRTCETIISKVMHVLDELFDRATSLSDAQSFLHCPCPNYLIPSEGFVKDANEGAVPG
jgi:hypothetical protein